MEDLVCVSPCVYVPDPFVELLEALQDLFAEIRLDLYFDAASAVKICPNTGLPCTGDGDCDEECDEEEEVIQPVATSAESVEE